MVKFQIYRDSAGEYRWRLRAFNGEIVAISEGYASKYSAIHSAERVKIWAGMAVVEDLVLTR